MRFKAFDNVFQKNITNEDCDYFMLLLSGNPSTCLCLRSSIKKQRNPVYTSIMVIRRLELKTLRFYKENLTFLTILTC